jgi:hypothetical protein
MVRRKTAGQHGDVAQLEEPCFASLWTHALCSPAETQDPALRRPASQVLLCAPSLKSDFADGGRAAEPYPRPHPYQQSRVTHCADRRSTGRSGASGAKKCVLTAPSDEHTDTMVWQRAGDARNRSPARVMGLPGGRGSPSERSDRDGGQAAWVSPSFVGGTQSFLGGSSRLGRGLWAFAQPG